uniref:Uncharacterized protein MANES_17G097400 n=1 Tax=Rhizophora mucronata TaxID=61149 RepID=A0A2P2M482_RHIMU
MKNHQQVLFTGPFMQKMACWRFPQV